MYKSEKQKAGEIGALNLRQDYKEKRATGVTKTARRPHPMTLSGSSSCRSNAAICSLPPQQPKSPECDLQLCQPKPATYTEETLGKTQNMLEGQHILSGLGTPRDPSDRARRVRRLLDSRSLSLLRKCSILEICALKADCWVSLSWEQDTSHSDSDLCRIDGQRLDLIKSVMSPLVTKEDEGEKEESKERVENNLGFWPERKQRTADCRGGPFFVGSSVPFFHSRLTGKGEGEGEDMRQMSPGPGIEPATAASRTEGLQTWGALTLQSSMPNESDRLERKEDKELKDVSEETAGQQVTASTPSLHRENTLQASSPRLVSVEELMETAKGVTNMALAHEIMVNKDFQVKPTELPEGSLEHKVKEIMHKVFWDRLEAQLNEDPPSYEHAIKLLGEIKETLLSFLLPGHGRLCSRIEEVLDLPLIQQQAENGALNIGQLSQFVVEMMGSLCAPCRDKDVKKLKQITEIVPLLNVHVLPPLRAIFSVLDLMKVDMANFALKSIKPHLMQLSVEYERNKFQEFLEKQPNALDYTKKWLEETVKSLRETDSCASASSDPPLHPLNVHNHAYIRLLRWDHASDPFPETVLMDQVRFLEMQQEAEWLVLLSSVLLIVYTTTGEAISGLPGLMETLKNTVSAMLTEMHLPTAHADLGILFTNEGRREREINRRIGAASAVQRVLYRSFSMQEALATIGEKLCVELSHCLSQHGFTSFSAESKSTLKGQITAVIQPDNIVRKLMGTEALLASQSRIQSYLLAALESSQHKTPPPLPGGLAPVSRELKELSIRFSRLVNYNKLVFSPFYQKILQNMLTPGESSGTEI
ncbi:hypothetical protein CCH79_00010115 [Gambusia affinis]|uniref:T-complex protein 11-like protein 1 n=1 Tax=Gambusia affinis TaxID=33528 RepID=A0A315VZ84_GAMAF|nr:hypothetical protein CCH79_00010115 [Gambusia affinis]